MYLHVLMPIGVCFVYIITSSLEYCLRECYLSFLVLLFHLFWVDILFLKNWVVVDRSDVAMIRRVICCCAVYSTPPLKT